MKLPQRLLTIADMIEKGGSVADIGADHALLCIYLVENGLADRAIASEIADMPYRRAQQAVAESGIKAKILVRQGNGLQTLEPGEVTTVVIAGMGGDTIVEILSDNLTKSETFSRYIFQPMTKMSVLRSFLAGHGWPILDEKIVKENGHYFVVMAGCPGYSPYTLNRLQTEIGPKILAGDTEVKREFIRKYRNKYTIIYNSLVNSRNKENISLTREYHQIIGDLEAILGES